ncbi:MAG TPA: hypothetical protein VK324_07780 [Tepidisphaeraceae bacterium]|nr:hypothetical protein [Tepidisphaeraceae bacterium]
MSLDKTIKPAFERALATLDDPPPTGPRLVDDAARLWSRLRTFVDRGFAGDATAALNLDALELACYAIQLPLRGSKLLPRGKFGRTNLRDRAEQAAELLVGLVGERLDEAVLDHATRILMEMPHRAPALDEAKLLADAINLEDFGAVGLVVQAIELSRQGGGVTQVVEGAEKREQYGYWDARLKDGFHYEPVRGLARQRLANARVVAKLLAQEIADDTP